MKGRIRIGNRWRDALPYQYNSPFHDPLKQYGVSRPKIECAGENHIGAKPNQLRDDRRRRPHESRGIASPTSCECDEAYTWHVTDLELPSVLRKSTRPGSGKNNCVRYKRGEFLKYGLPIAGTHKVWHKPGDTLTAREIFRCFLGSACNRLRSILVTVRYHRPNGDGRYHDAYQSPD